MLGCFETKYFSTVITLNIHDKNCFVFCVIALMHALLNSTKFPTDTKIYIRYQSKWKFCKRAIAKYSSVNYQ